MAAVVSLAGAQGWTPVPLVSPEIKRLGYSGGEGGQWPRAMAATPADPKFFLFGTDVGGLYRSRDGGRRWEPCNVGYSPRGTADLAIDPNNAKRCLSVGANSSNGAHHGIWLSTDGASSWRSVLPADISSNDDMRTQLAFDPATYDRKLGYTRVVYWSRIAEDRAMWGQPQIHPALYRSDDGGQSWAEIPGSAAYGGSFLRCHPARPGFLYAGNKRGFFRSTDGGRTFRRTLEGDVTGLDTTAGSPDRVWVSTATGVHRSDDTGETWKVVDTRSIEKGQDRLRNLKVSPVDPDRLVLWRESVPNNWNWPRFYSHDGGRTWSASRKDSTGAFLPDNSRQGIFQWDARDPRIVWSLGGDWATRSTDGGATFGYASDGYNGVLVGGYFHFNHQDPDLVFFGSQDYNGAITRNGGKTWTYLNPSGNGWGGYCYGGYAASANLLVVGNAGGWGEPRILRVSRDSGRTWSDTKIPLTGPNSSYGDPRDPNVVFAFNQRSPDGGATWAAMADCDAVITSSTAGTLFGLKRRGDQTEVVASDDHGRTWTRRATHQGEVRDLAYDSRRQRLYAVLGDRPAVLEANGWRLLDIPKNQFGGYSARTVAVDPQDPRVVYIGSAGNLYASNVAVLRSRDAGRTWENLTLNRPLKPGQKDGGREAICIRVHPKTREPWVATSCYGIWRYSAPNTR